MLPCFLAWRTFGFHATGSFGGFSLSSPIGGAANGMPRNLLTDLYVKDEFGYDDTRPSMSPYFVVTRTAMTKGSKTHKIENLINSFVEIIVF